MFNNIGEKIKTLATVCTAIGCALSAIMAIATWTAGSFWTGLLILALGCLLSWVGAFVLYGFGELIAKTTKMEERLQKMEMLSVYRDSNVPEKKKKDIIDKFHCELMNDLENEKNENDDKFYDADKPAIDECPVCFGKVGPDDEECPHCGHKLK